MIGKPLTEIFRLESVSLDERINYYGETQIREFYEKRFNGNTTIGTSNKTEWLHSDHKLPNLKGIDFTKYHTIKYNL